MKNKIQINLVFDFFYRQNLYDTKKDADATFHILVTTKMMPKIMTNKLSEKQRKVFDLYFYQHISQEEIARRLRITQPTVSRHLNRAIDKVNEILNYVYMATQHTINYMECIEKSE